MPWKFTLGRAQDRPLAQPGELRCSFCRKYQDEVQKVIAGPDVFICDECVSACNDIIASERAANVAVAAASVFAPSNEADPEPILPCSLCGMPTIAGERLVLESRGTLCAGCIGEFEAALEQHRIARGHEHVADEDRTGGPNKV